MTAIEEDLGECHTQVGVTKISNAGGCQVFEFGQGYVALSRVKRLSGLHLLGWNERALQVHPAVLEKDLEFKNVSAQAQSVFSAMPEKEITTMHQNFIAFCSGI